MFISVKRDMAESVPGHGYYVEPLPHCLNAFTIGDALGRQRNALIARGDHPDAGKSALQIGHAADVVVMVVGEQDRLRAQPGVGRGKHRRGIAGIDDHGGAVSVDQAPDVIVRECGQGSESHRIGTMPLLHSPRQATPTSWFDSEPAQALYQLEQQILLPQLAGLPSQPWLWVAPSRRWMDGAALPGRGLRLYRDEQGYAGEARCALPLPLPNESVHAVILQHVTAADAAALLAECERVLMPGGRLFLSSLNPFSPYRTQWRRHGMAVRTPQRLRQLLDRVGLECDDTRYVGPLWPAGTRPNSRLAPLRAVCVFSAEKRTFALPGPKAVPVRWRGPMATPGMTRSILETNENH